jgi:hypothetical protein
VYRNTPSDGSGGEANFGVPDSRHELTRAHAASGCEVGGKMRLVAVGCY